MKQRGMNLETVRIKNRAAILKLLINNGPTSRKDITDELSLTKGAVTLLCAEMITEGLIFDKGEVIDGTKAGRRKVPVDIKADFKFIISINIESEKTYLNLCDLKGTAVKSNELLTDTGIPAEDFLIKVSTVCKLMIWEAGLQKSDALGVGVCIPGIVDREAGISKRAYGIWNYSVPVESIINIHMGCPVIIENNVKAFAQGELLYGAGKKHDNLLFVKWGPGVGSAIVINNTLYEGKDHKAAEIGHFIVEPDGRSCRCGRKGCLETMVSTGAVIGEIRAVFSKEKTPDLYERLNGNPDNITSGVMRLCRDVGDEPINRIFEECVERLARTVINAITVISPDRVILFGSAFDDAHVVERFLHYSMNYDPSYDSNLIKKSKLDYKINYIGPTAIVANELFFEKGGAVN